MNYKIVADSASNVFSLDDVAFSCVPLKIICGDNEYVDTPELDLDAMLQDLKTTKQKSSTSCPNVYDWVQSFEGADHIFAVCITGNLSGSYSAAEQAKELYLQDHPEAKIHVINTLSAGPEMRLIVEKLQQLILKGMSFEYIVQAIKVYATHTHLTFCLQSLTNLARNGRVSPAIAKITSMLGIRLVGRASDVGTLEPFGKIRGEAKTLEAMLKEMISRGFKGGLVRISHCLNLEAANTFKQMILDKFQNCDVRIEPCSALCSFYAEIGGMLVGYESL